MQKKADKRTVARKNAEAMKAKKKAARATTSSSKAPGASAGPGKKGKSLVPQSKAKRK